MSESAQARETRIVEETLSLIDYTSRFLGAVESGNWHYAEDKLHGLRNAVEKLQRDLNHAHVAELRQINGTRVWSRVERFSGSFWVGRAITAWNKGGAR